MVKNLRKYIQLEWEVICISIYVYRIIILGVLVEKNDEFFEQLHNEIEKVRTSRELIMMGDINSRVGKKDNSVIKQHGEETVNNGHRFIEVCE